VLEIIAIEVPGKLGGACYEALCQTLQSPRAVPPIAPALN